MPLEVSARTAGSNPFRSLLLRTAVVSFVLLGMVVVSGGSSPAQEIPAGALQLVDSSGLGYYAHAHPYLEERLKHLVKHIPELETLRPAADQEILPIILMHTGMKVDDFFHNIVDLVAREEVGQEILSPEGTII
jgi:hypothetical protein